VIKISHNGTKILAQERTGPTGVEYTFPLAVPATEEPVTVIAQIDMRGPRMRPIVHVKNVPDCRRHRYSNHSLCMWFEPDGPDHTWTVADGLEQLVAHVARHLYQEAVCRAGDPWPGVESPGRHPRPTSCTTCGGEGD